VFVSYNRIVARKFHGFVETHYSMVDIHAPLAGTPVLFFRRFLFGSAVLVTFLLLLVLSISSLSPGGIDGLDLVILVLFATTLPWTVVGFWNALIGFMVMRLAHDPVAAVCPAVTHLRDDQPITLRCAVLVCIRNEDPQQVVRNLSPLMSALAADAAAPRFHFYVLSDTDDTEIARREEEAFGSLASTYRGQLAISYRRRPNNSGFKAGNIRDFCERWGGDHDVAITLDADSVMPASAALRLVRIMQAEPRLGILQGLVVGLPTATAFARIFQFGMRFGMRSYTIGSAWWQGDCGPYWGHNAILRLAPFAKHCQLPQLPNGKDVLSHDQIEAVLMRRAGYEVRVLPEEDLGWEQNPPTLIEFIRRDLRWCQGNMQYWRFLFLPRLKLISRCQLAIAILMFVGSPAWVGLMIAGTLLALREPGAGVDPHYGWMLLSVIMFMWFAPKIATIADVLARPRLRRANGGTLRLLASVSIETLFFILLSPIQWFSHTIGLFRLMQGSGPGWGAQSRHAHTVPFTQAAARFWPHTLAGLCSIGLLALYNAGAIPVMLLIVGGMLLSIPFAILTAMPWVGSVMVDLDLCSLPEERAPPETLRSLDVAAYAASGDV
jgi:membrane glycosyltransferase